MESFLPIEIWMCYHNLYYSTRTKRRRKMIFELNKVDFGNKLGGTMKIVYVIFKFNVNLPWQKYIMSCNLFLLL